MVCTRVCPAYNLALPPDVYQKAPALPAAHEKKLRARHFSKFQSIKQVVEEMRNRGVASLKFRMDLHATTIAEAAKQRGVSALVIEQQIADHGKESVIWQLDLTDEEEMKWPSQGRAVCRAVLSVW